MFHNYLCLHSLNILILNIIFIYHAKLINPFDNSKGFLKINIKDVPDVMTIRHLTLVTKVPF